MTFKESRARRWAAKVTIALTAIGMQACACISSDGPISTYHFEVFRPRAVVVYKPIAGIAPADDRAVIYLALQNDSEVNRTLCFACYSRSDKNWYSVFFNDVVPTVNITVEGAPIVGAPEVRLDGADGKKVTPGKRFPDIIPDPSEFPLNEANYRRDFAIVVHPDRSKAGATGNLLVSVSLARTKKPRDEDGRAEIASFRIPITISDQFRPETMTTEPSQP